MPLGVKLVGVVLLSVKNHPPTKNTCTYTFNVLLKINFTSYAITATGGMSDL